MDHFTPISAAAGGALIGLSATLLWLANGRIAGISGILGGILRKPDADLGWRLAFLAGLLLAPLLVSRYAATPAILVTAGSVTLVVAGLLVGVGTRLGGGCTSGHGVCGIARLSRRSIVATAVFMVAAMATVAITHHLATGP